jgi:four helix bundle protein
MSESNELQEFLHGYRRLIAWQKAKNLAVIVHRLTAKFPSGEFRAKGQLNDAVTSISANVAEGYCRGSGGDYLRFLDYAHGSFGETGSRMEVAHEVGFVSAGDYQEFEKVYKNAGYFLHRLMQGVRKKVTEGTWDHTWFLKEGTAEYEVDANIEL